MQHTPLVSIYIPTHNRINKLERAINSVLSQTYENYEILICDDGSTDSTQEKIKQLSEQNKQIRYFRNPTPMGACAARNLGIFSARGEFITGLDDDDEFTPNRIEHFLKIWDDKYSFMCSNFSDKIKNKKEKYHYSGNKTVFTINDLLVNNEASNQVFTRTERLQSIQGFREGVKRLQDWDTWLRLCSKYGYFYREKNALYIMHHDHEPTEKRVSESLGLDIALDELCDRNKALFDEESEFILRSLARRIRKEFTLIDMTKSMKINCSIKPLFQYIYQFVKP